MTEQATVATSPAPGGFLGAAVRTSLALGWFVDTMGKIGSIFILPMVLVTMWDVLVRKIGGLQYWLIQNFGDMFESTKIQELEWHFHTALFVLVLGYTYVHNRHIRVDLVRENLSFRQQAWIEFLGCTLFLIPYCVIVTYYAFDFAWSSYQIGEISASTVGLAYRWIIKTTLAVGLVVALVSGVAVGLQAALVLFGPKDLRFPLLTLEWPEEQERKGRLRQRSGA